ncbi:acetolactate synthase small subunit 2 chloroplastic-like [Trifolium medium]|uniref:Acetolactate synthase small subunit 2 chloroplastic-like n=1 Tax=Trifolium medium TaxID=97028 RepID=A0A392QQL5_9FABA|nr:acetolactate synthase small subunit 2 chloroplastic-like [Trifolium medium]
MGASAPFWRYSAASYPDLEGKTAINALVGAKSTNPVDKTDVPVGTSNTVDISANDFITDHPSPLLL